jgi:hypothetical protein
VVDAVPLQVLDRLCDHPSGDERLAQSDLVRDQEPVGLAWAVELVEHICDGLALEVLEPIKDGLGVERSAHPDVT